MNKKVIIISSVVAGIAVIGGLVWYLKVKKTSATTQSTDGSVSKVMQQPSYAEQLPSYFEPVNYIDSRIPSPSYTEMPSFDGNYA
jgi:hypothetical protein